MVDDYTEKNIVSITIEIQGNAVVLVNGEPLGEEGNDPTKNLVSLGIDCDNYVLITINGEDFHIEPEKNDETEVQRPGSGPDNGDSVSA